MEWIVLGQIALVVMLLAAQLPALRRQWLEDRNGTVKALRIVAYYLLYTGVGIAILISTIAASDTPTRAFLVGVVFFFGWVLLGVSWLIKTAPRNRPVAAWLLRPVGPLDVVALILIVVSLPVMLTL